MSWVTSPAATELEERMMEWLREMLGLPDGFTGVIQDTASTATLCAILTARETRSAFAVNQGGFAPTMRFTCYASREAHSSIEKGVKIAGIGKENLRLIGVDARYAMIPEELERAIVRDREAGHTPLCVVAALGTTGSTAIDPLREIGEICRRHGLWFHVDAAYAGTALLLPEMRPMAQGSELADSFVVNPHKWMLTNFDCTAYFVRDTTALIRTFAILPEYLKSAEGDRVNNYRDWGIQLGRRFRALKLWFVIRNYGVLGLQEMLRAQCALAQEQRERIERSADFELLAPVPLNVLCFRYHRPGVDDEALNAMNAELLERVNRTGKAYCTHTTLDGRFAIRMVIGQARVAAENVERAWELFCTEAASLRTPR
jgi:aromatic-L-amino-acid decarboxylase